MPVLDHPVHPATIGGQRYGCHSKQRDSAAGYYAPDGRVPAYSGSLQMHVYMTFIMHTMSRECRYDMSLRDPKCAECPHQGSGERYTAEIQAKGK